MDATTAYISGPTTSMATTTSVAGQDTIVVTNSDQVIDPGPGFHKIQFLGEPHSDEVVLHASGLADVSGFDPATDVLDLRSLLRGSNVNLHDDIAILE